MNLSVTVCLHLCSVGKELSYMLYSVVIMDVYKSV